MVERAQVVRFLKLNGIDATAPDEEIKSLLMSARWREEDVEAALTALHEDPESSKKTASAAQRPNAVQQSIFRSDEKLAPDSVTALLGIDIDLSVKDIELRRRSARGELTAGQVVNILLISLVISSAFIIGSMWVMKVGIFHQSITGI